MFFISRLKKQYPSAKIKKSNILGDEYIVCLHDKTYNIKVLGVTRKSILTINSPKIWQIKFGKVMMNRFKTSSSRIINLSQFNKLENRVVVFKSKPYKILKHLNESDIIDISSSKTINETMVFKNIESIEL